MLENVHTPTLAWSSGITVVLVVLAVVLLVVWIRKKES